MKDDTHIKMEDNSDIPIRQHLHEILDINLEKHQKTLEAFNELSEFLPDNTLNSRKKLRSRVETRGIGIIEDFLKNVEKVKLSLDKVHNDIARIDQTVDTMINGLQETKNKTSHLQDHIDELQQKSEEVEMQQLILSKFMEKLQLSDDESKSLKGPDVTNEFFDALNRTYSIHNNCKLLLESGNQVIALSIMEQMTVIQSTALELLYPWVQIHCKDIEVPKISVLLSKAMKQFQNRMVLFSNLIEEYGTVRRSVMVRLFLDVLTKVGPDGVSKPIESYAHDKKRYVGDMLAWLRQYIPLERENLMLFLKECNTSKPEIKEEVKKAMSNITEGVCSALSVRIGRIISSSTSPFELYDTASLLRYYNSIFEEEIPESILNSKIDELTKVTEGAFLNSIQSLVRQTLLEKIEAPTSDLRPTAGVGYLLNFMTEILGAAGLNEGRKEFILKIVNCIVDPLLQAINLSASRLTSVDMSVYLLNCINEILNVLSVYEFTDEWLERLQAQADAQLDTLTSEQASSLVANLHLRSIYTILQDTSKSALSKVPGMDTANLENFLSKMETFLHTPDIMTLPQVRCIQSNTHRNLVQHRANEVIVAVYKQLYSCIHDPNNLYENPSALMPHSPKEISKLLLGDTKCR